MQPFFFPKRSLRLPYPNAKIVENKGNIYKTGLSNNVVTALLGLCDLQCISSSVCEV